MSQKLVLFEATKTPNLIINNLEGIFNKILLHISLFENFNTIRLLCRRINKIYLNKNVVIDLLAQFYLKLWPNINKKLIKNYLFKNNVLDSKKLSKMMLNVTQKIEH